MNTDYTPKTIEDLCCYWITVHGVTHKTMSSLKRDQGIFRNYIFPAFGGILLEEVSVRKIEEWFSRLKLNTPLAAKSCNNILGLFKKVMNDAERWGFINKSPVNRVKNIKLPELDYKFWSLDEIRQYIGYWSLQPRKPRIFYCVLVALYTGMRRGELNALMWDCISDESGLITVKKTYCRIAKKVQEETKSKKIRRIPICKVLKNYLSEIKLITTSSGLVLPFFHPDCYHKEFKVSAKRAGVKEIRFHDLRHTFASHFLMGGGNIYDLQRILGHSTIQMTERYLHLVPDHLRGKTEVLEY